ncbi:MAG: sigma-70 family RNA polymerase sigma factor [Saprospiraceae bacterium]|nr:sigma-70 family RNA polymerase sigma factor [Saprospiraceae bacterium]
MNWRSKKRYKEKTDQQLAKAYRDYADAQVLPILFKRYSHLVLGICANYLNSTQDCEDAAMEIYMTFSTQLRKKEINNIEAWLYQVTKNHCLKILRQRKKQLTVLRSSNSWDEFMHKTDEYDDDDERQQAAMKDIKNALNQLKPLQRKCFSLYYLEGYSYKEIAESTSLQMNQVKSHIQNGKRNIKNALAN